MTISLKSFSQVLRPYQSEAVKRALSVPKGGRLMLVSPTGTGKGTMQLGLLTALRSTGKNAWIVTPSLEVLRGYLERCGATEADLAGGAGALAELGASIFVTTPVRLRNRLAKSTQKPPEVLIIDEAHHATLDTISGGGLAELCPGATRLGWTATGYRGSPEETQALKEVWGEFYHVLDIPAAVENGAWCLPKWRVEPLVNDDELALKGGDIDADEATLETADALAALVASLDLAVPTCVTTTSIKAAQELESKLLALGVESRTVLGTTPTTERAAAFARVKQGGAVLVSVKVLGEGVDLPWLRRWVDASPTLSPVAFMQKLGRITRPHPTPAEYVGTNRNLERHGYLLQGKFPRSEFKLAQERFGGPSMRAATSRVRFLKSAGKVKPIELPLADGVIGTMYALWHPAKNGGSGFERCIILDPTSDTAVSVMREVDPSKEGKEKWGAWTVEAEVPATIEGFKASKIGGKCSLAQLRWWDKEAAKRGLDQSATPTRAQFFALPVLVELNGTLQGGMKFSPKPVPATETKPAEKPAEKALVQPLLPDGYYTVADTRGGHRTYRIRTQDATSTFCPGAQILAYLFGPDNESDYRGVAFVEGTALRIWRKAQEHSEQLKADWAVLTGAPEASGKLYALRCGRCYRCARQLTTPESVETGLGAECAEKMGMEWGRKTPVDEIDHVDHVSHIDEIERAKRREAFKKIDTANEGNIPLMARLLTAGVGDAEIETIYVTRYTAQGKTDLSWIRDRVRTYKKIARKGGGEA